MSSNCNNGLIIVASIAVVAYIVILSCMYAKMNLLPGWGKCLTQNSPMNATKERDTSLYKKSVVILQDGPMNSSEEKDTSFDEEISTYQPRTKENVQYLSPREYILGFFACRAVSYSIFRYTFRNTMLKEQKELVLKALSEMPCKNDKNVIEENWNVWLHAWPYMVLSIAHTLMSEINPQFKLSDAQVEVMEGVIKKLFDARLRKLDEIQSKWPFITSDEWFEKECVKLGPFYTREFMNKHLLSGLHRDDVDNHDTFYQVYFFQYDLPEFMNRIAELVERCCKDVWCDSDVINKIADIIGNHRLEKKWVEISNSNIYEGILMPTQQSMDLICGELAAVYRDAILRRVDMNALFDVST